MSKTGTYKLSGVNLDITWITTAFSEGEGVSVAPITDPTGSDEGVSVAPITDPTGSDEGVSVELNIDSTVLKAELNGNAGGFELVSDTKKQYTSIKFKNGKLCLPVISENTDASKPESRVTNFSKEKCFTKKSRLMEYKDPMNYDGLGI